MPGVRRGGGAWRASTTLRGSRRAGRPRKTINFSDRFEGAGRGCEPPTWVITNQCRIPVLPIGNFRGAEPPNSVKDETRFVKVA